MSWGAVSEPGSALRAWALARVGTPFAWGATDCALLACEAVDVQTPALRLAERYRGRYASLLGALRFQIRAGVDLASVLAAAGLQEIPPGRAAAGDILIVPDGAFACGHVVFGVRSLSVWPEGRVGWCWTADLVEQPGAVAYTLLASRALECTGGGVPCA